MLPQEKLYTKWLELDVVSTVRVLLPTMKVVFAGEGTKSGKTRTVQLTSEQTSSKIDPFVVVEVVVEVVVVDNVAVVLAVVLAGVVENVAVVLPVLVLAVGVDEVAVVGG